MKFDIGAKISIVGKDKIKYDSFYLVAINEEKRFAELLSGDGCGEILPLFPSNCKSSYYIFPGFLSIVESFIKEKNVTIWELIDQLNVIFSNNICLFDIDISEKIFDNLDDDIDIVKLYESVREKIINQDELVKKVITSALYNQKLVNSDFDLDTIRLSKKVLLVLGKTGTGKTEVMKQVSKDLGIPYVIEDATKFTMEGYVGRSVSDMLLDLYRVADNNLEEAQKGILIIDEIDKRCKIPDVSAVASTGVQTSLLKLIEGEKLNLTTDKGSAKDEIVFDTSLLTVFLMGAFEGMEKKGVRTIGFNSDNNNDKSLNDSVCTSEDLVSYGMIPELVGRISSVVKTNDLDLNDFKDIILKSSISPLKLQEKFYSTLGIDLKFDDEFVERLAKIAKDKNVGARGIKLAFDEVFSDFEFEALNKEFDELCFENGKVLKRKKRKLNFDNFFNI